MTTTIFTTYNLTTWLGRASKVVLMMALIVQSSGLTFGETYATWQSSATIAGNSVSTAPLTETFTTKVVTPDDMATSFAEVIVEPTSWFFFNDENNTIDNTLGSFVAGPGVPLYGTGSAQISVSGTQRRNLATYQFAGTKLSTITTLSFRTYNPSVGNGGSANRSAYLHFNVTFNGVDTWQSRLVFVPANNDTVMQNTWQEWDALDEGNALWRWSRFENGPDNSPSTADDNTWPDGNSNALRTWDDLVASFPHIAIRTNDP